MEACLLCLEINKDILDCIHVNSIQWQELNIAEILEKHFWSLSTIQPSSWICLSCWREVDGFHKFFLRIEEAHVNFGKIKIEDCSVPVKYEQEDTIKKSYAEDNDEEMDKDRMTFCFLEPEILIDQTFQGDITEPVILLDQPPTDEVKVDNETTITEPPDQFDLDNMPLKYACKRLRLQNDIGSKNPLEKSKKSKKKNYKTKVITAITSTDEHNTEDPKVKVEPVDFHDNNGLDSFSGKDDDTSKINYQPDKDFLEAAENKRRKTCTKHRTNRKQNDKYISENFKQMFCDLCKAPFENFSAALKHFADIHKQRGYVVCCKRKFFVRTGLVDHLHCHLNPDHFKCNECGKAMADRISFESHMLRVHRANEVVKPHCCDVCGKPFREACLLRIHRLTHLTEDEKKFPCDDCGKNYGSPYLLNQHRQAVHLKRFVKICNICGKAINSSAEFKVHMNKHEGIPLPIINCEICGLRLTSERGLKLHKESQHPVGGKQEHPCPICPKVSPTLKALQKHVNTMHKKGYDHKCSICEKAFKRSEVLREHMATHTGTTLYTCPWCPKTFNSNSNMYAHRKNVHPKEWKVSKLQKYFGNIPPEI